MEQYNVSGSGDWPVISLGGFDFSTASNIVFSNGEYDPWRIGDCPFHLLSCCSRYMQVAFSHQSGPLQDKELSNEPIVSTAKIHVLCQVA